jgi:hypothetical protein
MLARQELRVRKYIRDATWASNVIRKWFYGWKARTLVSVQYVGICTGCCRTVKSEDCGPFLIGSSISTVNFRLLVKEEAKIHRSHESV